MLNHISVEKLLPDSKESYNSCIRGAKIEHLEDFVLNQETSNNLNITDIIVHAGSNNLPNDSIMNVVNKLASLLRSTQQKILNAEIYFSPIIPKYDNKNIEICDKINDIMRIICKNYGIGFIQTRNLFVNRNGIKFERLSKYDQLHLNKDGILAMGKHLKYHLHMKSMLKQNSISPPPYSP